MSADWNTRKLAKITKGKLYQTLNNIGCEEQVLVVQPNVLPFLNKLLSFSELKDHTPVRKIVIIGDQLQNEIEDIISNTPNIVPVFLLNVRLELNLPKILTDFLKGYNIPSINAIYCSWQTQRSDNLLTIHVHEDFRVYHLIETQLTEASPGSKRNILTWNILPMPYIDDKILICDLLYNDQEENMYAPQILSMQSATREILRDNIINALQSLLETTKTTITHSIAIGEESKKMVRTLRQRIEEKQSNDDTFVIETMYIDNKSDIETDLIVIDRSIDPLTPLLTQLTYAGILDDLYNMDIGGKIKTKDITLDYTTDDVWNDLKFLNFGTIGPRLNQMARDLQDKYDSRHNAESVGEIKEFVDSLGTLQEKQRLLKLHTGLSSEVLNEVETNESLQFKKLLDLEQDIILNNLDNTGSCDAILDIIYESEAGRNDIIRLLCILSLCKNGIRDRDYWQLKKELINSFGIVVCFQLERLAFSGLFLSKTQVSEAHTKKISFNNTNNITLVWNKEYRYISNWLNTLPDDDSDNRKSEQIPTNHKDATFAYCGVVPLTYRIIQLLYDRSVLNIHYSSQQPFIISRQPNISKTDDLLKQIFGNSKIAESSIWHIDPDRNNSRPIYNRKNAKNNEDDIVILCFIGGITFGELAVIKFLQEKLKEKKINKRFIVVSDGITNGDKIINSSYYRGNK